MGTRILDLVGAIMMTMTPAQTAKDILETLPPPSADPKSIQFVRSATMSALRHAIWSACDNEECLHRILARCRAVVHQHVIRAQVQADADAALEGKVHPRSEQALQDARELLASVEARLGLEND